MSGARRLEPGATVGVLGGGQLGRMLAQAATRMGYRTAVFSPSAGGPAAQAAQHETVAPYDDLDAVARFAAAVEVVTIEFENIPVATLEAAGAHALLRPGPQALHVAQHRGREKAFIAGLGVPVAPHALVEDDVGLAAALERIGTPAILKSAGFGYDGKGQRRLPAGVSPAAAAAALAEVGAPAVLERVVPFEREYSQIVARGADGALRFYPPIENLHVDGILDLSLAPARIDAASADQARDIAAAVADALEYVGVLCVELFDAATGPVVNEIAPRPHNSGHLTIEAAACSQFEQQLRAACALPLGEPRLRDTAGMINLLGDLWATPPDWGDLLGRDGVQLHLYGKEAARPGRKMGHLSALHGDLPGGGGGELEPQAALAASLRAARSRLAERAR